MATDYSSKSAEEQMKHGELTPDQILTALGLDKKKYKVEKNISGDAVNAVKKQIKNAQIFQYDLYQKENGKWVKKKWNKEFFDKKGLNNYAIYGENGIVIIKPYSFAKDKKMTVSLPKDSINSGDNINISDDGSGSLNGLSEMSMSPTWCDVKGYSGNDEEIIKNISFAKLCLLKECYESLGILL